MTALIPPPIAPAYTRARALELDAADPLAPFRDRYLPQTDDVVAYLERDFYRFP